MSGARYSLRVDVAKPADIYKPSFGPARSPARQDGGPKIGKDGVSPGAGKRSGSPGVGQGRNASGIQRVLGKRRVGGRTEFLVKWYASEAAADSWVSSSVIEPELLRDFEAKRQRRQLLQSQARADGAPADDDFGPMRILAHRGRGDDPLDGSYLVQRAGTRLSHAMWMSGCHVEPALLKGFREGIKRVRALKPA